MSQPGVSRESSNRPRFDAQLIGELRHRVVAHNAGIADKAFHAKLGDMKKIYKANFAGRSPAATALAKVDQHLAGLLAKAQPPEFDPAQHPRGRGGQFVSGGQRGLYRDVRSRGEHRDLQQENAGYEAFQTQVIPETRYTVYGAPIAGAAGVLGGAAVGATATMRGSVIDRAATSALGGIGGAAGKLAAAIPAAAIRGGRTVARAGILRANQALGTQIPRPGSQAGEATITRIRGASQRVGRGAGRGIGRASAYATNAPAAAARGVVESAIPGFRGRMYGRGIGAVVGGLAPGALMFAPTLMHVQERLGPYLDATFPRHVRKADGGEVTEADVLAKRDEILGGELAKATPAAIAGAVARIAQRYLSPRQFNVLRGTVRAARGGVQGARASAQRIRAAGRQTIPPVPPSPHPAATVAAGPDVTANVLAPKRFGRTRATLAFAVPVTAAGAAVGAITGPLLGPALARYNQLHPRDQSGRFTHKGSAAISGARIGAAVGAGLGIVGGAIAARHGRADLLRGALRAMGEAVTSGRSTEETRRATEAGIQARAAAVNNAQVIARTTHARAHLADNPHLGTPGESVNPVEHIRNTAENLAEEAYNASDEGKALLGGAKAWYKHKLDLAFEKLTFPQIKRLADRGPNNKRLSLRDKSGKVLTNSRGFVEQIDRSRLNDNQRKLLDDAIELRDRHAAGIDQIYEQRKVTLELSQRDVANLNARRSRIERDVHDVESLRNTAQDLELDPKSTVADIRAFAGAAPLRITMPQRGLSRDRALDMLKRGLQDYHANLTTELNTITEVELPAAQAAAQDARAAADLSDLTTAERMAVENPFRGYKDGKYLDGPPNRAEHIAKLREEASKPFLEANDAQAQEALEHLNAIYASRAALLRAGLPDHGLARRIFNEFAPRITPYIVQGNADYHAIMNAYVQGLPEGSVQRQMTTIVRDLQNNPKGAWEAVAALSEKARLRGKQFNTWFWNHWKPLTTVISMLGTVGAIDLNAEGIKKKLRIDPKTWRQPKNIQIENTWVDPVNRPHDLIFGLSYRDPKDNTQKFMNGAHVTAADGTRTPIPFGTPVDQYVQRVRQQNNPNRATEEFTVPNQPQVVNAIDALRRENRIQKQGDADFEFDSVTNENDLNDAQRKFASDSADVFYNKFILPIERLQHLNGRSTNRTNDYFDALHILFSHPASPILSNDVKRSMLVGGGLANRRRGIFANSQRALTAPGNPDNVARELIRQINNEQNGNLRPKNKQQADDLLRATWLIANHHKLSVTQYAPVRLAIFDALEGTTAQTPPPQATAQAQPRGEQPAPQGSPERGRQIARGLLQNIPPEKRYSQFADDDAATGILEAVYTKKYRDEMSRPDMDSREAHMTAQRHVQRAANGFVDPVKKQDGLRLWLRKQGEPPKPRVPRLPRIGSYAKVGRQPSLTGNTIPHRGITTQYLHEEAHPARALSQLGTYGLGQAGFAAASRLASRFVPGAGIMPKVARFGLESIGGFAGGGVAGPLAGQALGRRIAGSPGPKMGEGESIARGLGGLAGTGIGTHLAPKLGPAAVRLGQRAVAGVGQRIGGWIGSRVGAGLGEAAGTAVVPVAGTLAGGTAGWLAGQAIGAGAGWLADEGIGLLYRHLSRYGSHVPHMAAKSLGAHKPPPIAGARAYA